MEFDKNMQSVYIDNPEYLNDRIDIRTVVEKYAYYWKWFLLSFLIFLALAFVKLRYSQRLYQVSSTILINDKESGGFKNELSAFQDIGTIGNTNSSLTNEIGILKSRKLLEHVVKQLGINKTFYEPGTIMDMEKYREQVPVNVNLLLSDSLLYNLSTSFKITVNSASTYIFEIGDENEGNYIHKNGTFGETLVTPMGQMVITPKNPKKIPLNVTTIVVIQPIADVVNNYINLIEISEPDDIKSSLLTITLSDPVHEKAQNIVDELVSQYNRYGVAYNSLITKSTDDFINNRIDDIYKELNLVDLGVEQYKRENKLTDIAYEAELNLASNSEIVNRIVDLNSQIKLIDYITEYINNNPDGLIPSNLGLRSEALSSNALTYNQLVLERNRILENSSLKNPTVILMNTQISNIKQNIKQSLNNLRASLSFSLNEARIQEGNLSARRTAAPTQEREFQDIARKQQIIESLYLYLLQKREENAITLGATSPNAQVIDVAHGGNGPVYPNVMKTYALAGLLGLILPGLIIFIFSLLDNKIHRVEEIEKKVKAPILGDIPELSSKQNKWISVKGNDNMTEAFRLLRTNMQYLLTGQNEASKTIMVTSTIAGEGKTFVAINLATILAATDKKVLLIGADLRKPKMSQYLKLKQAKGLTHFLVHKELNFDDIVNNDTSSNIDVIVAGEVPPNPAELLLNERFSTLLKISKQRYSFIIIDTAPVNLVTDTLLISDFADLFIYVIRANFLDKRLLKIPQSLYENRRLPHMAILLNGMNSKKVRYGYGYGYGYGNEPNKKKWWKFR